MFKPGETTNRVQQARVRRTQLFFSDRDTFMEQLEQDIHQAIRFAARRGLTPVFRLNATSDISWEKYALPGSGVNVFESFPDTQFYDYTKILGRKVSQHRNYHLTFSRAEDNHQQCEQALAAGMNVAVVYDRVPADVFAGDHTDLRFLDPRGVIVGLRAKGRARHDHSGFVVRLTPA
jgi:hypothetical protein